MSFRRMLAVWAAKIVEKISVRVFHKHGVTWAGKIALKICPSILKFAVQTEKPLQIICFVLLFRQRDTVLYVIIQAQIC